MNAISPVDPSLALQQASQHELVQKKLSVDALRQRLGDNQTKQEKLREQCEGFEAIFMQKMWEQMRKNVPKEGYLHSKDEEAYQSMFDVELCKKMASAGGIGLADMLYEQLSQKLDNTGRTTSPGSARTPFSISPAKGLLPDEKATAQAQAQVPDKNLTAATLYSPLEESAPVQEAPRQDPVLAALGELQEDLVKKQQLDPESAAGKWAAWRNAVTGTEQGAALGAENAPATAEARKESSTKVEAAGKTAEQNVDPAVASWQGPGRVGTKAEPSNLFGRSKKGEKSKKNETQEENQEHKQRGMAPNDTLWPIPGEQGNVVSQFGYEDDPATGKRRWNSGVRINTAPGSDVRAVLPGKVIFAGQRENFGNSVVIEHEGGYRSYYSNLAPNQVKVGQKVEHGAVFAKIQSQPSSPKNGENSASLYFELKKGEMAINPESAIQRMMTAQR